MVRRVLFHKLLFVMVSRASTTLEDSRGWTALRSLSIGSVSAPLFVLRLRPTRLLRLLAMASYLVTGCSASDEMKPNASTFIPDPPTSFVTFPDGSTHRAAFLGYSEEHVIFRDGSECFVNQFAIGAANAALWSNPSGAGLPGPEAVLAFQVGIRSNDPFVLGPVAIPELGGCEGDRPDAGWNGYIVTDEGELQITPVAINILELERNTRQGEMHALIKVVTRVSEHPRSHAEPSESELGESRWLQYDGELEFLIDFHAHIDRYDVHSGMTVMTYQDDEGNWVQELTPNDQ
ncbi:MAG: hypothetical protein RBU37_08800 [Myxococcota bacterium]|jgi:hypothetical protein|nr:hypothetical protein [Myxococcota bacterium]